MRNLIRLLVVSWFAGAVCGCTGGSASAPPPPQPAVVTKKVQVPGKDHYSAPSLSEDGLLVAFTAGVSAYGTDSNVYVLALDTGVTQLVSTGVQRSAADGGSHDSGREVLSRGGRYVVFSSEAGNLVPNDTNGSVAGCTFSVAPPPTDVFVMDRQTGATTRVSVDSNGRQPTYCTRVDITQNICQSVCGLGSSGAAISADGRFIAFNSDAADLVSDVGETVHNVFIHDMQTGATRMLRVDYYGPDSPPRYFTLTSFSADGRFVALQSDDWGHHIPDVFVVDTQSGTVTRANLNSSGNPGNGASWAGSLSADGRYVAFESAASNLVSGDTNGKSDVFVRDRVTGATTRVSLNVDGTQRNERSYAPVISGDGRMVAFRAEKDGDVFVYDRVTGSTVQANVDTNLKRLPTQATGWQQPSLSGDGRFVAFVASDVIYVRGPLHP